MQNLKLRTVARCAFVFAALVIGCAGPRSVIAQSVSARKVRAPSAIPTDVLVLQQTPLMTPGNTGTPVLNGPAMTPGGMLPPSGATLPPTVCDVNDYWIVSSRGCKKNQAQYGNGCCLTFHHNVADRCLVPSGYGEFMASLRPDRPVCFVIHGSYNWWKDVVSQSRLINRWLHSAAPQMPVQVVFFTWPADGNMPLIFPIEINILARRSSFHAIYMAQLISQFPPNQPVSFVGHSLGARSAVSAMHLLGGGAIEGGYRLNPEQCGPRRMRAALLAAAIDHNWLNPGQRYGQALCPLERLLIMRNKEDFTLCLYPFRKVVGQRSLGRKGLGWDDRQALDSLNCKITEMDASPVTGWGHAWADYYEHPELAPALLPYVQYLDETPVNGPNVNPFAMPMGNLTDNNPNSLVADTAIMQPTAPEQRIQLKPNSKKTSYPRSN